MEVPAASDATQPALLPQPTVMRCSLGDELLTAELPDPRRVQIPLHDGEVLRLGGIPELIEFRKVLRHKLLRMRTRQYVLLQTFPEQQQASHRSRSRSSGRS